MTTTLRYSLIAVGWGACLWAVLMVSKVPIPGTHAICGPWGCGPPMESLIACHGAWLVLLMPAAVMFAGRGPLRLVRRVGFLFVLAAALGIAGIVAYERWTWFAEASEWHRSFFWQRCGFRLATLVDVPLVQSLCAGAMLLALRPARRRPVSNQLPASVADTVHGEQPSPK